VGKYNPASNPDAFNARERVTVIMGRLFIIATPIGNLDDVTYRCAQTLGEVEVLACEDTRQTRKLLERHGIAKPERLVAYHEHNEETAGRRLLAALADGANVGLCSDGGMPGVSDPGYRLVSAAIADNHEVQVLPGPSAVQTALILSGLPTSTYTFKGFPPRKSGARIRFLAEDADRPHTLILFESPHRIGKSLADAVTALGDRQAAVCIELTKKFERVSRGYLRDLSAEYADKKVRGEVTLVIAGNHPKFIRTQTA